MNEYDVFAFTNSEGDLPDETITAMSGTGAVRRYLQEHPNADWIVAMDQDRQSVVRYMPRQAWGDKSGFETISYKD